MTQNTSPLLDGYLVEASPDDKCEWCGRGFTGFAILLDDGNSLHEYCSEGLCGRCEQPVSPRESLAVSEDEIIHRSCSVRAVA